MNCSFYILELAVIAIGVGAWLHISDHDRKYVTRAEFDKHLAEMRVDLERLGASRRDVVPSTADVNRVDTGLSPVPDLHDGNGPDADVGDDDASARSFGTEAFASMESILPNPQPKGKANDNHIADVLDYEV